MTVGRRLTPARLPVDADRIEEFDLEDYLAQLRVREGSPAVGTSVEAFDEANADVTVLQVRRDGEVYAAPHTDQLIQAGDRLVVHGTLQAVNRFRDDNDLRQFVHEEVTVDTFEEAPIDDTLAKAVVPEDSAYVGETVAEARLQEFHQTTVLAIRRGGDLIRTGLDDAAPEPGDLLLLWTTPESIQYFAESGELIVADEWAYDRLPSATSMISRRSRRRRRSRSGSWPPSSPSPHWTSFRS